MSVINDEKICLEIGRLETFDQNWPHADDTMFSRDNMAKAGFFYTGQADCVKCFACHVKLNNWELGDDPWSKHLELSPDCLFARLKKEENSLTVEQFCDVMCARAINMLDSKINKVFPN